MKAPSKRTLRAVVILGIFVLAFGMYISAEAGADTATAALLALTVALMIAGILTG